MLYVFCSSLKECVPHFLEILVSLIADEYVKVAEGSRRALELFTSNASGQNLASLLIFSILNTVKAFYFVGQKFRRLKTTDIFVGT